MRRPESLLPVVVTGTLSLLGLGGLLLVVWIFDEALGWDLLAPRMERALYGVFGASIALGLCGTAATLVLGIENATVSLRNLQPGIEVSEEGRKGSSRGTTPAIAFLTAMAAISLLLSGLSYANQKVQLQRCRVFKAIAAAQMERLGGRLLDEVAELAAPEDGVSEGLADWLRTMRGLSFCSEVTLFLPDAVDSEVLWSYRPTRDWKGQDSDFRRFFIARDMDRAIHAALQGDAAWLEQMNGDVNFVWFHIVQSSERPPLAVLRIDGNPRESFRDYQSVTTDSPR